MRSHTLLVQSLPNLLIIVQYLVPPASSVNRDFLKAVLADEKRLLKVNEARYINMPKYDELSVKNIFPRFRDDPSVMVYL